MTPDPSPVHATSDLTTPEQRKRLGARSALGLAAAVLVAVPFVVLAAGVLSGWEALERVDQGTADRLHSVTIANPDLLSLLRFLADATDPWVWRAIAVGVAIGLWRARLRPAAVWLAVTMVIGGALSGILKLVVARARPEFDDPAAIADGYSFPSGHALNSMLFAACMIALFHRRTHGAGRALLWAAMTAVVLVTGWDRIALGVHFVSDVVAGWVVALATVTSTLAAFGTAALHRPEDGLTTRDALRAAARRRSHDTAEQHTGWPRTLGGLAWRVLAVWAAVLAVLVVLGLLVTRVLDGVWPLTAEDAVNRALEAGRTDAGNTASFWMSQLGNTATVVGLCVLSVAALRLWRHRWRESFLVLLVTLGQSVVFLCTTLAIDRERPDVFKLDDSPPTSSFPSGHTGAAFAIYLSLAVTVHRTVRRTWLRRLLAALLVCLPVMVAVSRLYRGMHHPSDVVGSLVNAGLLLLLTDRVLRGVSLPDDHHGLETVHGPSAGTSAPKQRSTESMVTHR